MNINIHQVDAFTDTLFGGNPAGVVSNADGLTDRNMHHIAREMNLSETAFVLEPQVEEADLTLRFFTPTSEVDFCGHATIGTLAQLARLSMFGLGEQGINEITVHTKAETLKMSVDNSEKTRISFTAPSVQMKTYSDQGRDFAKKLGVSDDLIEPDAAIYIDQKLRYIYIPVVSLKALGETNFNFNQIKEQFIDEQIVVFCLYTPETIRAEANLHARGLAPLVGVGEDPFTGSMQAGLLHAAKLNGIIAPETTTVVTEQGHFIDRPGSATLHHSLMDDVVTVTAEAVPVFSAEMEVA